MSDIFSFAARKVVADRAYRATRKELLRRYDELAPILARHGLRLRREVLEDTTRDLWSGVGLGTGSVETAPAVVRDLHALLDRLDAALQ